MWEGDITLDSDPSVNSFGLKKNLSRPTKFA